MSAAARLPILVTLLISSSAVAQPNVTLRTADAEGASHFGRAVALSADWTIVTGGAWDNASAFVFERQATGTWIEIGKLPTDDPVGDIAIDGQRAIVGAGEFAYIFEREGSGTWIEAARLEIDLPFEGVSLSGNRAVVSCTCGSGSGLDVYRAYVFERDEAGTWVVVDTLEFSKGGWNPSDGGGDGAIAIDGDQAIVGTWSRETEDGTRAPGAAHLFERNPAGHWIETAVLEASDKHADDYFGWSVSIEEGRAIVGAAKMDAPLAHNPGPGAAYVFERSESGVWVEAGKLQPEGTVGFGFSVSISGERALVGEWWGDDSGAILGEAFIFERDESGTWAEVARMSSPDSTSGYGYSVAIDRERAVVGAPLTPYRDLGAAHVYDVTSVGTDSEPVELPAEPYLLQNYPNPFNPTTTISYSLPTASEISLTVVDVSGRTVAVLDSGTKPSGEHKVHFQTATLASGTYLYRLQAGDYVETKSLIVAK